MTDNDFRNILQRYEKNVSSGKKAYFDADEMLDIIGWYMEEERDADADAAISFARRLHPANSDIRVAEARLRIYQGNYKAATAIVKQLDNDDNPETGLLVCDILLHEANRLNEAELRGPMLSIVEKSYDQLIHQVDNDPGFYSSIISQHSREELFNEANKWIDRAFALYPDQPEILDASALCYAMQGRATEAGDLCNRLIDCDPYNARSWGILGDILHDFGDFTQALEAYDYVKAIRSDESLSERNIADCHFALGHYAKAYQIYCTVLEKQIERDPTPYQEDASDPNSPDEDCDEVTAYLKAKKALCELNLKKNK